MDMDLMPEEILTHIFHFLPADDLILSVSKVCRKWQEAMSVKELWKHKIFTPQSTMSTGEITDILKMLPSLQHFIIRHGHDFDEISEALCKACPDIKTIIMDRKHGPRSFCSVEKLLNTYPQILTLDIYCEQALFHLDYAKLFGKTFKDSSLVVITSELSETRKRLFGIYMKHNTVLMGYGNEALTLISQKIDALEYLGIGPEVTADMYATILKCRNLKKLLIFSDCWESRELYLEDLISLENLDTLQLNFPVKTLVLPCSDSYDQFSSLVKLEIIGAVYLQVDCTRTIWDLCPNLEHVRIRGENLSSECFRGIGKCRALKHMDLSLNRSGVCENTMGFISECAQLEFLDLSYSYIRYGFDLEILSPCEKLKFLWIEGQTEIYLKEIPAIFPNLIELKVSNCYSINEDMIKELQLNMPQLNVYFTSSLSLEVCEMTLTTEIIANAVHNQ